MFNRRNHVLMAALGAVLSAGAAAVASTIDTAEKFAVTGALKVTHIITEQVCNFDTLEQLEGYLEAVADRHHWFRHDQAAPNAAQDQANQVDTTATQYGALAAAPAIAPAQAAGTIVAEFELDTLRTALKAETASADASSDSTNQAAPAATTADTPAAQ